MTVADAIPPTAEAPLDTSTIGVVLLMRLGPSFPSFSLGPLLTREQCQTNKDHLKIKV